MNQKIPFVATAMAAALILATRFTHKHPVAESVNAYKTKNIISCSPDWAAIKDWLEETDIPPIPGSGTHIWKINTKNDSAQFYFNQGINIYYSFHIIEAMASFKKAARFDPECAMLYWAQALTYGPNINDYGYAASPEALDATQKALQFSSTANEIEKGLINSISVRYTVDSADTNREMLNKAYTAKMKELYEKYPDNADVPALYADAMMLEHPWDLWYVDGRPKEWTPHIREVLEKLLSKYPNHPGANHYYIHVMEPSPYAYKALPSADLLGKLTPGLSHTVHMPSHIYLRTGNYARGVSVNEDAVNSYKRALALFAPVSGNEFIYVMHNLHMQTNHAMMLGQSDYSDKSAEKTRKSVPEDYLNLEAPVGSYMQYLYMTPVMSDVRFGKWESLLAMEKPKETWPYANVLYYFGRGFAFTKKGNLQAASKELDAMREFMKDPALSVPMSPFSPVLEGARVAEQLLLGVIHEEKKMNDGAIRHYALADSIEKNMVYTEPRDWMLNPKHFLGNAYLRASKWKEAENIFRADLNYNNENGWALYGLYKTLQGQKKNAEAEKVLAKFNKAFSKADIQIGSPVY